MGEQAREPCLGAQRPSVVVAPNTGLRIRPEAKLLELGVLGSRSQLLPFSRSIYKKAGLAKEKRQVTYLVAKKGVGPRVRRPPGVKGQFKVVDSRLKKDVRAQKRKEQKKKHHK